MKRRKATGKIVQTHRISNSSRIDHTCRFSSTNLILFSLLVLLLFSRATIDNNLWHLLNGPEIEINKIDSIARSHFASQNGNSDGHQKNLNGKKNCKEKNVKWNRMKLIELKWAKLKRKTRQNRIKMLTARTDRTAKRTREKKKHAKLTSVHLICADYRFRPSSCSLARSFLSSFDRAKVCVEQEKVFNQSWQRSV